MWAPRWTPWQQAARWSRTSHECAVANARLATTELSRRRVERDEVELFLRSRGIAAGATVAEVPQPA